MQGQEDCSTTIHPSREDVISITDTDSTDSPPHSFPTLHLASSVRLTTHIDAIITKTYANLAPYARLTSLCQIQSCRLLSV